METPKRPHRTPGCDPHQELCVDISMSSVDEIKLSSDLHFFNRQQTASIEPDTHNPDLCGVKKQPKDKGESLVSTSVRTALTNTTRGEEIRRKQSRRDETSQWEGRKERTEMRKREQKQTNESKEETLPKQKGQAEGRKINSSTFSSDFLHLTTNVINKTFISHKNCREASKNIKMKGNNYAPKQLCRLLISVWVQLNHMGSVFKHYFCKH